MQNIADSKNNFFSDANGRVNLIGEHTDYNGGWVLPTAIPQTITARLAPRGDNLVRASTLKNFKDAKSQFEFSIGNEKPTHTWIDYVQGCTFVLREMGFKFSGFNLELNSTIPSGSGLSSSAALLICLLKGIRPAFSLSLSDLEMAKVAQKIENTFVGANVGIMDQMASTFSKQGEAIFLDTQDLSFERITLPMHKMDLIVINSGVEHNHANGDYNKRRSECESACKELQVKTLREITYEDVSELKKLPELLQKRARHVVTENHRVHQAVAAIREGNIDLLGELFYASHASMRDDYEISVSQIDLLVNLCRSHPAVYGARLTGGGFGGSIICITKKGQGQEVARSVKNLYEEKTGLGATILVPQMN